MNLLKKTFSICLLITISVSSNAQQIIAGRLDSIFTALYNTGQFSGSVLIAKNGNPVYQKSFGLADIEKQLPNGPETRFLLASVSKQFTAIGIVLLKEAGKLNYDDTVVKYLPEFPYRDITIRQLLNHTSGVPDYDALMQQRWDKTKYATNNDMLNMLIQYHPDPFNAAGQKYNYSNTGYALLALIIEKISDQPYPDYMKNEVFEPLKMTHTLVYTRRARPKHVENCATGYVYDDSLKQFVLPEQHPLWKQALWEDGIYGEDGVNTTTGDLLLWDQVVHSGGLINADDWQQVLTPAKPTEGTSDYGFGWHIINPQNKGRVAYHTGGWPGFMTYNEQGLDKNYSIIILRNKFAPRTRMPVDNIRELINSE